MKGAREFAKLFETGQYGKLYITSGSHAMGRTFYIQTLPDGEKAIPNGSNNTCINKNAVEVYGVTGGNQGRTEKYGWLHKGKWKDDFMVLVKKARTNNKLKEKNENEIDRKRKIDDKNKELRLLDDY